MKPARWKTNLIFLLALGLFLTSLFAAKVFALTMDPTILAGAISVSGSTLTITNGSGKGRVDTTSCSSRQAAQVYDESASWTLDDSAGTFTSAEFKQTQAGVCLNWCGVNCSGGSQSNWQPFLYSLNATLSLTPAEETPGSHSITVCGSSPSSGGSTKVCDPEKYFIPVTLSVSISPAGSGSVINNTDGNSCPGTCSWVYSASTPVTLTATPVDGYSFSGWSGDCSGTGTSCTLTMNADKKVTATFAPILTVSVTGSGTVTSNDSGNISCTSADGSSCSATYSSGTTVTLTATSASGYTFDGWGGDCSGSGASCAVTMDGNRSVTATFSLMGTVQVYSVNSVTGSSVPSSWTFPVFPSADTDPCSSSVSVGCTNLTDATYPNMPTGMYTNQAVQGSAGPLYVFANYNSSSPLCPPGQDWCTLTLDPASGFSTIVFTLNWDPIAQMAISSVTSPIPSPSCADGEICLSDADQNGSLTIENTSTAGGSELNWSVANQPSWLNISTPAPIDSGKSQTVAIIYSGSLPRGTNTSVDLEFDGISFPGGHSPALNSSPQSVTVNLSIPIPPVTITPDPVAPSPIVNVPYQFRAKGGMGTSYTCSVTGTRTFGCTITGEGDPFYVTFPWAGDYKITVADTSGRSDSTDFTVTAPPASCTFTADPPTVVLLATTTLTWRCWNASTTSCTLTPPGVSVPCNGDTNSCLGSYVVTPATSTSYTLYCGGVFGGASTRMPLPINIRKLKGGEIPPQ